MDMLNCPTDKDNPKQPRYLLTDAETGKTYQASTREGAMDMRKKDLERERQELNKRLEESEIARLNRELARMKAHLTNTFEGLVEPLQKALAEAESENAYLTEKIKGLYASQGKVWLRA